MLRHRIGKVRRHSRESCGLEIIWPKGIDSDSKTWQHYHRPKKK